MTRHRDDCGIESAGGIDEDRLYPKVGWRLLPLIYICYLAAYVDRVNVGFAKLQMLEDLNLSDLAASTGPGLLGVAACIAVAAPVLFVIPATLVDR